MASPESKQPRDAWMVLDSCLWIDAAKERNYALEFFEVIDRPSVRRFITDTIIAELDEIASNPKHEAHPWGEAAFEWVARLKPAIPQIASQAMRKAETLSRLMIEAGEIAADQRNDGIILGETSLAAIPSLVTANNDLLGLQRPDMDRNFRRAGLTHPVEIVDPKEFLRRLRRAGL